MSFRYCLLFCIALSAITSCGQKKQTQVQYGVIKKSELIATKGIPSSVEKPIATSEVLVYADNQKYQVTNDVVTTGFRNPTDEEKNLLYWRHQFKDCDTTFTEMGKASGHMQVTKEFKCETAGVSVVYDPNIDQVTRVVEYAKK